MQSFFIPTNNSENDETFFGIQFDALRIAAHLKMTTHKILFEL